MTAAFHLRICLDFIETALLNSGSKWHSSELYEAHQRAWGYLRCPKSEWTQTHTAPHYPPGSGLPALLAARNFLAPYAGDYAKELHEPAFSHALAQYDARLPEAFAQYRQMRLNDIGAIWPITPEQLAELQAYPGFETILVEDWCDEAELFERVPMQAIVLQSLGFLEEYIRPYSRSHQMLFDYPAATRAFFQGRISSAELAKKCRQHWQHQRNKFNGIPHLRRQEGAMGFFLWEAAWNEELAGREGVQDPPFFYFLDNLTKINAGLALQWRDYVAPLLRAV
ncbi:hypothetical protein H9Q10_05820 [Eikenella sp. S3360]|uniref:PoNi C-terminal domain-containing protein n=1 Tax=Eikenella glucosivorans TaxID=2766967 RepID=A0ABS0NAA5_9NEIS|nr:hypothetical protein [Eikenella glucosivorans]MBH5329184.1 hypothetical protein [Eikenella glucosivorans]